MELNKALMIAEEVVDSLRPHCELINVVGSCRRGKAEVKDIELVVIPKQRIVKDVFGEDMASGRSKGFVGEVESLGERIKGSATEGRQVQIKLRQGVMLDLFIPCAQEYYRHFATRTGSKEYSQNILAAGWRRKGWCGSDVGLRRMSDCTERKKADGTSDWRCVNQKAELPPVWQSEQEFFAWIGARWVEPRLRTV